MPQATNITVKKADGTTNYVWTLMSPSAGDGSFAQWNGEGASRAAQGKLRIKASSNAARTTRRVNLSGMIPVSAVDPATGLTRAVTLLPLELTLTTPNDMPTSSVTDAVAILTNTLTSSLVRDCFVGGVSAT